MISTRLLAPGPEAAPFQGMTFPKFSNLMQEETHPRLTVLPILATVDGKDAGLVLGAMAKGDYEAPPTLFSLYVSPAFRRQGVGTALMEALHAEIAARGGTLIRVIYMTGKDTSAGFERILQKTGWEPPTPRMAAIKADLFQIRAMDPPWLRERRIDGSRFAIIPWSEVTDAQKTALRASHEAERWIAEDLTPWKHEKDYDPVTSCAVLRDGQLVSWVINHVLPDGTTRFTCSFAHPRLQRFGIVFWLYKEAVDQMEKHDRRYGMWTVPLVHPGMHAFAMRWMKPCAVYCRETYGCEKKLAA